MGIIICAAAQACKAFSRQHPQQQPDAADGDRLQQREHKKVLILSKKGNLSKAYKQLTQDGLVDHDASDTLPILSPEFASPLI